MHTPIRNINPLLIILLAGVILAVSACSKQDPQAETVGQKVDKAIDKSNAAASDAGRRIEDAAGRAGAKLEQGASQAEQAIADATKKASAAARDQAGQVASVVDDSAITASVKADLLKDPGLSVLKVEVNTVHGEVTLSGKVDSEDAKARAGRLAAAIAGVQQVRNELQIVATPGKGAGKPV